MPIKLGTNNFSLKIGDQIVDKLYLGESQVYDYEEIEPIVEGRLKLTFLEESSFYLNCNDESLYENLELFYKINNGNVGVLHFFDELYFEEGDVLELFGNNATLSNADDPIRVCCEGSFNLSGDIRSLLSKNNFRNITTIPDYAFWYMFAEQPVVSAEDLILGGNNVGVGAFDSFFRACISLIDAPEELPARNVGNRAYEYMFSGCSIINCPIIKADTVSNESFRGMFSLCQNLIQLPSLIGESYGSACCYLMFMNCPLIKLSTTQTEEYQNAYYIPNGVSNSYREMFENTGGSFAGTPNANTIYYTSNEIVGDDE